MRVVRVIRVVRTPWGQEGGVMHEDRPREWDIRLGAGPVPVGDVLPLVMASIRRRARRKENRPPGDRLQGRPGGRGQEDRR